MKKSLVLLNSKSIESDISSPTKLTKENNLKFKKKVEAALPDFTNIDYEMMLINKYRSKPDDVKALYRGAYFSALNN